MNQDQVKDLLLGLDPEAEEFFVIFSGKKSKKVNGLYKPASREIIIHNKNMQTDNALLYTAIHEFAHHIQFTRTHSPISARCHTGAFRAIFHSLLFKAEKQGIYKNGFDAIPEFQELTVKIKRDFLAAHGGLIRELGAVLVRAMELCSTHGLNFEDYVNRTLKMKSGSARFFIKLTDMDIDPGVGYENMKTLSAIRDPDVRKQAETALKADFSPDMVRTRFIKENEAKDPVTALTAEKTRLEKTIAGLNTRLSAIKQKLQELTEKHAVN
jgi:hypothetical protein